MIGDMKERIQLWEESLTSNGIGGYEKTEVLVTELWAAFKWKNDSTEAEHQQVNEKRSAEFLIRERVISPHMFLRFRDYKFGISTLTPKPKGYLTILAEGEKDGG